MKLSDQEIDLILTALELGQGYLAPQALAKDLFARLTLELRIRSMAAKTPERWEAVKDELHRRGNGTLPTDWREQVAAFSEADITRFTQAAAAGGVKAPRKARIHIASEAALDALLGDMSDLIPED